MGKKVIAAILMASMLMCGCGGETEDALTDSEIQDVTIRANEVARQSNSIDGFENATHEYERFNSYASENGLEGTKIYVDGFAKEEENENGEILGFVLEQEDGNLWSVGFNDTIENLENVLKIIIGNKVRVFGTYTGYTDKFNMPVLIPVNEDGSGKIDIKTDSGNFETIWNFSEYLSELEKKEEKKELEDFQEEEPFFSYSGTGDDVVAGISTESISYAHIVHEESGHFSIKGHYGDSYDLLVNTTESYNGTTLIYPGKEYTFEVSAKGEWSIELYKLGTSSADSFSGSGDFITPIFTKTSDVYEINTNGGGHFSVKGWNDSNYDLLVNTTDENYSGKVMFNSEKEYAFFEISASREWEIKPAE